MKKRNWFKLSSLMFGALVTSAILISPFFVIDSNKFVANNVLNTTANSLSTTLPRVGSDNLQIFNIGDFAPGSTEENIEKNSAIARVYKGKPSQVQDFQIPIIVQVLNPDIVTIGNKAPVYTNLSRHPADSPLTADDPLSYFTGPEVGLYTPNYFDNSGFMAFRVDMWEGNIKLAEYFLVSGFNSQIIVKTLPGIIYQNTVNDLSNAELTNFISFAPAGTPNGYVLPTSKTLVPNSRVQEPSTGTISFALNLIYDVPTITFDMNVQGAAQSQHYIQTNFQFKPSPFTGFQPSGNLSTQQLLILISVILGICVAFVLLVVALFLIIKKIKFRNAL